MEKYLVIFFILLVLLILVSYYKTFEKFNIINNNNNDFIKKNETVDPNLNIEIVVARYNENLDWLNDEPFNRYKIIVYNSGDNDNFYKNDRMEIVKINNIGKEAYVYLYHIITRYDNLADITIFLPGSSNSKHKIKYAKNQVYLVEKYENTVFLCQKYTDVRDEQYYFEVNDWKSTSDQNSLKNTKSILNPSKIRPFGRWYDEHFNNIVTPYANFFGILGISKRHILHHPKEYYENLLNEFEEPNDEVAHYFERVWYTIFYPMEHAILIERLFTLDAECDYLKNYNDNNILQ